MSTDTKTTITLELTEREAQVVHEAMLKAFFLEDTNDEERGYLNHVMCALEDINIGLETVE